MKYIALYNPKSGSGRGEELARRLDSLVSDGEIEYRNFLEIDDYGRFFAEAGDCRIVLCGGDGTINYFVNNIKGLEIKQELYMFAAGSGNDFLFDVSSSEVSGPVYISQYLKNLPSVEVNGHKYLFVNGVGYGIDGYDCEVADKIHKEHPGKKINYAAITIKGLLLGLYKPCTATVTVDGKTQVFKRTWVAPTMNGRYYGGGMNCAPNQDRLNAERTLSCVVMHGGLRLPTLIRFTSIFKGTHINKKKYVSVMVGKDITVKFSRPCALQIDGETVLGVTEYRATSSKLN